jgi:hypothetical protein
LRRAKSQLQLHVSLPVPPPALPTAQILSTGLLVGPYVSAAGEPLRVLYVVPGVSGRASHGANEKSGKQRAPHITRLAVSMS